MKRPVLLSIATFISIAQIAAVILNSNGIAGYNNSPGEITCTNCHITYPLNDSGSVTINIPSSISNNYIPGLTYTINVKIAKTGPHLFGFSTEALDSAGANAGTFTLINSGTTTLINALVHSNNRTNVTHYGGVFSNDSCTFSFKWTAPATNAGRITFYTAANASNGDGYVDGDYIYNVSKTLNPDLSAIIADKKGVENLISVFPNPTSNQFFIEASTTDKLTADLYDINGRHVLSTILQPAKGDKTKIDVSHINEGVYTLTIKSTNGVINKKLVIVR